MTWRAACNDIVTRRGVLSGPAYASLGMQEMSSRAMASLESGVMTCDACR